MCKEYEDIKDTSDPYGWNDGSSLGGTTWSTPTDDIDDGGYEPDTTPDYEENEREM